MGRISFTIISSNFIITENVGSKTILNRVRLITTSKIVCTKNEEQCKQNKNYVLVLKLKIEAMRLFAVFFLKYINC